MTENVENLVLEQLRAIRNQLEGMQVATQQDFQEVKQRLSGVESGIAGLRRDSASTLDDVYRQQAAIDRLNERIQRIERRLELT